MIFIYHAATLAGRHPPSSLSGLAACLDAGAAIVEIDLVPLADGDFALLHDISLDATTDGRGSVAGLTAEKVRGWRLRRSTDRGRGTLSGESVGTLSEAVALVAARGGLAELQLDLKPHLPLTDAVLKGLLQQIRPIQHCVRVTSVADWALRRLRALDAGLALGFDPLLYLDVERPPANHAADRASSSEKPSLSVPPYHTGAYGYLDDHPLATERWGSGREYLAARAEGLAAQAAVDIWYVRATLLARMLDDGFDGIDWLHRQGIQVAAWTLNPDQPHHIALARRLSALGVDRITTDDPEGLAAALEHADAGASS